MAKEVIDGLLYDTDRAEEIGRWSNGYSTTDFNYCRETLYRTEHGQYFIAGEGGPLSRYRKLVGDGWSEGSAIRPLSEKEAREWAEEKLAVSTVLDEFGESIERA